MPGIAGVLPKTIIGDEEDKLKRMMKAMLHEPFYASGTYVSKRPNAFVGFSAIKGSSSDCMPIMNEKRDIVLFLTGECFHDHDVMAWLSSRGHEFCAGDASCLIHVFEEKKDAFFSFLNGCFNGLIIDYRSGLAHLFNDRSGMRRLYYYENNEALYFSTEAKSLLAIFPQLRSINPTSLGEYFVYDCVLENRTLFQDVQIIPPGSVWTFDNQQIRKGGYSDMSRLENLPKVPESDFFEGLENTFVRILPRYLSANSNMLALTGGMDTRMIIACANAQPGELPCYTHGGMYNDMLDVRIARKVAKACGQEHHTIRIDKKFLNDFPSQAARTIYITDGLANVCQSHLLWGNSRAREIAPIRITGKFGSQIIKRISAFHRPTGYDADERLISQDLMDHIRAARGRFTEITQGHPLSVMLFKELPWWWGGPAAIEFSQLESRSPYLDNEFVDYLYRSPFARIDPVGFQMSVIKKRKPELHRIMTNKGYGGHPHPILRIPRQKLYKLLILVEKAYGRDKLPHSIQHPIARMDKLILSPLKLNRLFLGLADYRHYRIWFRDDLSPFVKDILLDQRTLSRSFWNKQYLEKAVWDHIKGRKNRLPEIRKSLTVELIYRTLIESSWAS